MDENQKSKMKSAAIFTTVFFVLCPPLVNAGNTVVAWGDNAFGQTNVPPAATNVIAIAAGNRHSLALNSDGTVIGWGLAPASTPPAGLSSVVAIAAGSGQSLALKNDGSLVAWGNPLASSYTNIPPGLSNIVAIACGDQHNLVLKADGTIFAWGQNYSGQTNIPSGISNVVAIAAGNTGNLAIRNDGTAWGSGTFSNILKGFSNIVSGTLVANGNYQGAVLLSDGSAHAWGYAGGTNLTVVSNVIAAVGRSGFNQAGSVWALKRDGTLTGLGAQYLGQTNVYLNLSNVLAIAIGYSHHMAIVGDSLPLPLEEPMGAAFTEGRFTIAQPTSRGRTYRLEYKDSTTGSDWQMLPPVPGDGTVQILSDPQPIAPLRLYRVYGGQ
jgi:alpha-tubulin suppressor-like RCC1 family protein